MDNYKNVTVTENDAVLYRTDGFYWSSGVTN